MAPEEAECRDQGTDRRVHRLRMGQDQRRGAEHDGLEATRSEGDQTAQEGT